MSADAASPIDLSATAEFVLGGTRILPSSCEISAANQTLSLEPRVMQVLVYMARRRGETITRDDLIAACWRGVVVGEDAIQRCIGRVRKAGATLGGFEIQTLNRLGYRLREVASAPDTSDAAPVLPVDGRPTIAVLKLDVYGSHPEADSFARLLAQDVGAALSFDRDLRVVAASTGTLSAAAAAAMPGDYPGDALGVRYLVAGTLRQLGEGFRLTVQLLVAGSSLILWNHRIDLPTIETPSDDLVIDISGRLSSQVMRHETNRALRNPSELTAWEAVVRGNAAYQRISLDNLPFAIAEYRRAVNLDPQYAAAHAGLANGLAASYEVGGARDPALAAEAQLHCDRALTLDSSDPTVLTWVASALGMTTRPPEGMDLALRAVELAPTHPFAHLNLARRYIYLGQPEAALACLDEHERVAPLFPWQYYIPFNRSLAHFMAGRMTEAVAEIDKAAHLNPDYPCTWLAKAILASMLENEEGALAAIRRLQRLEGEDSLELQIARIAHSYPSGPTLALLQARIGKVWRQALPHGGDAA